MTRDRVRGALLPRLEPASVHHEVEHVGQRGLMVHVDKQSAGTALTTTDVPPNGSRTNPIPEMTSDCDGNQLER